MEEKEVLEAGAGQSQGRKEGRVIGRRTIVDGSDGSEHSVLPHLLVDLPVDARWDLGSDGQLQAEGRSGARTGGIGCEPRERENVHVRQHCEDSEGEGKMTHIVVHDLQ
jgi:hypothetical protein